MAVVSRDSQSTLDITVQGEKVSLFSNCSNLTIQAALLDLPASVMGSLGRGGMTVEEYIYM